MRGGFPISDLSSIASIHISSSSPPFVRQKQAEFSLPNRCQELTEFRLPLLAWVLSPRRTDGRLLPSRMPGEHSSSSRSTTASGGGRGRRRVQPIEVDPPFIDVEAIDDDDVTILSPSRTRAPASNVSRRRPVICLDDDDDVVVEVNHRHSGVAMDEEVRIVSGNSHNKRVRISPSAGGSGNKNIRQTKPRTRNKVIEIQHGSPQPVPVDAPPPPPKEPTFSCPVCLNQLNEPCSTTCGHVFCQSCIKTSIQVQKKCPTCRKKLNMKSFHRLYLPNTVN